MEFRRSTQYILASGLIRSMQAPTVCLLMCGEGRVSEEQHVTHHPHWLKDQYVANILYRTYRTCLRGLSIVQCTNRIFAVNRRAASDDTWLTTSANPLYVET